MAPASSSAAFDRADAAVSATINPASWQRDASGPSLVDVASARASFGSIETSFADSVGNGAITGLNLRSTLDSKELDFSKFLPRRERQKRTAIAYAVTLSAWEGVVTEMRDKTFLARLTRTDTELNDLVEVEIEKADISPDDLKILSVGVLFYYAIARNTDKNGTRTVSATIIFRRFPTWKSFDINAPSSISDNFFSELPSGAESLITE